MTLRINSLSRASSLLGGAQAALYRLPLTGLGRHDQGSPYAAGGTRPCSISTSGRQPCAISNPRPGDTARHSRRHLGLVELGRQRRARFFSSRCSPPSSRPSCTYDLGIGRAGLTATFVEFALPLRTAVGGILRRNLNLPRDAWPQLAWPVPLFHEDQGPVGWRLGVLGRARPSALCT